MSKRLLSERLSASCAVIASVAILGCAIASRAAAQADPLFRISSALSVEHQPRLHDLLKMIAKYFGRVDASLPAALRNRVQHDAVGAYGSAFLTHNQVSNDLDIFVNVHLGSVQSSEPTRRDAALQILKRVRAYRDRAEAIAQRQQAPAFAFQKFMQPITTEDLSPQSPMLEDLASSLRLAWVGRPYLVTQVMRGGTQVSELEAGLAYLPLVTHSAFLSNVLDQAPGIFTGVREISVQLYFSVDLQPAGEPKRKLSLSPLAPPRQVAKLWQQAYSGVYLDKASGELVLSMVPAGVDPADLRLSYARGFLGSMAFEREVRRYPIKFLKRLHPIVDALAPRLSADEHATLTDLLELGLHGDAAVLADQLKTEGEALEKIASNPALLATFTASGDVTRMLHFFAETSRALRMRYPGASAQLDLLDALLSLIGEQPALLRVAAAGIADCGLDLVRALGIDDAQMAELWQRANDAFAALGYRSVHAYATANGSLALSAFDLACGDDRTGLVRNLSAALRLLRGGDFEVLSEFDPRLTRPGALARPDTLYVRCSDSAADNTRLSETKEQLLAVQSELRVRP